MKRLLILLLLGCIVMVLASCSEPVHQQPKFVIAIFDEPSSMNEQALEQGKVFIDSRIVPLLEGGDKFGIISISGNSFTCPDTGQLFTLVSSPITCDREMDSINSITLNQIHRLISEVRIRPEFTASDILGALARASTFFVEDTLSEKILIIISDMEENVWRPGITDLIKLNGVRVYALFISHKFKNIKDDVQAYTAKKQYWENLLHSTGTANSFLWDDDISRLKMDWLVEQLEQN
ncbi:MAG: hypothetical protein V1668_03545 [Patescibacteria group bacterium]